MTLRLLACLMVVVLASVIVFERVPANSQQLPPNKNDERLKVTVCQLKQDPAAYNHQVS